MSCASSRRILRRSRRSVSSSGRSAKTSPWSTLRRGPVLCSTTAETLRRPPLPRLGRRMTIEDPPFGHALLAGMQNEQRELPGCRPPHLLYGVRSHCGSVLPVAPQHDDTRHGAAHPDAVLRLDCEASANPGWPAGPLSAGPLLPTPARWSLPTSPFAGTRGC